MKRLEAGMVCVITFDRYCPENMGREVTLVRVLEHGDTVPELGNRECLFNSPHWLVTAPKLSLATGAKIGIVNKIITADYSPVVPQNLLPITPDKDLTEQFESELLEYELEFVK